MSRAAGLQVVIASGTVLGGWVAARVLIEGVRGAAPAWAAAGGMAPAGVALCAWGLGRRRRWALWLSRALAAAAFGLGGLAASFHWDFWLWMSPTLRERIQAVLKLDVVFLLAVPLLWLLWSARPDVRRRFR